MVQLNDDVLNIIFKNLHDLYMIDLKKELLQLQDIYFHEEHMYCIMGTCYNDIDFDRDPETNCIRCGALWNSNKNMSVWRLLDIKKRVLESETSSDSLHVDYVE